MLGKAFPCWYYFKQNFLMLYSYTSMALFLYLDLCLSGIYVHTKCKVGIQFFFFSKCYPLPATPFAESFYFHLYLQCNFYHLLVFCGLFLGILLCFMDEHVPTYFNYCSFVLHSLFSSLFSKFFLAILA